MPLTFKVSHALAATAIFTSALALTACAQTDAANDAMMPATANAPVIQAPAPIVYLADNLDEPDQVGWCIDTKGRAFQDTLHAHSCKPAGEDVLFSYDAPSGQIRSATYDNKCTVLLAPTAEVRFGLVDCDANASAQMFDYDSASYEFSPRGDRARCISVGDTSRAAGPWVARDLLLTPCAQTAPSLKQWLIMNG